MVAMQGAWHLIKRLMINNKTRNNKRNGFFEKKIEKLLLHSTSTLCAQSSKGLGSDVGCGSEPSAHLGNGAVTII
jgi:hypothetical protein